MDSVLCVGCSWTRHWPSHLPLKRFDVTHRWLDGKGIHLIGDVVREQGDQHDWVVLQLPTPIRWERTSWDSRGFIAQFLARTTGDPGWGHRQILDGYFNEILTLNELHPRILFFNFSTGGYPFQAPHDFGKTVNGDLREFAYDNNVWLKSLNLTGIPDQCLGEEVADDQEPEYEDVNVVHPHGKFVVDPHPSMGADRNAARHVEDWIRHHEDWPVSR